MVSISKIGMAFSGLLLFAICSQVFASAKTQLQALVPQVQSIAAQSNVINSVDTANQSHANLSATDVRNLGREWHQGLIGKNSPILTTVNNSDLSAALKNIQAQSNGQYLGILVTDAKGLVIGQTYNAEYYSEAHRSIWSKIAKEGVNAVYYGKTKSTQSGDMATLGLPIVQNDKVVGAILVEAKVTPTASAKKAS